MMERQVTKKVEYSFVICVILFFICSIWFTFFTFMDAWAEQYGIILDRTCIQLIKNNMSTICPTYEEIITLFPDTSNQYLSGYFGYDDGYFHRLSSPFGDNIHYYRFDAAERLYIDPPASLIPRLKIITITSHDFTYKIPNQIITNSSYMIGQSRYIDDSCGYAILQADNWITMTGDTIYTMSKSCANGASNFDDTKMIQWEGITHDITTSYKYRLDQWYKNSINKCGTKICLYENNQAAPP